MSWAELINKNINLTIEKKKKKTADNLNQNNNNYDDLVEDEFNYKYGDSIFNDIFLFHEENQHDNHILSCIEPSFLYNFFMEYIDKEDYYEAYESEDSLSESEDYSD